MRIASSTHQPVISASGNGLRRPRESSVVSGSSSASIGAATSTSLVIVNAQLQAAHGTTGESVGPRLGDAAAVLRQAEMRARGVLHAQSSSGALPRAAVDAVLRLVQQQHVRLGERDRHRVGEPPGLRATPARSPPSRRCGPAPAQQQVAVRREGPLQQGAAHPRSSAAIGMRSPVNVSSRVSAYSPGEADAHVGARPMAGPCSRGRAQRSRLLAASGRGAHRRGAPCASVASTSRTELHRPQGAAGA